MRNFFDCLKDRTRLPVADVFSHCDCMDACHICNINLLLGRDLKWDPQKNMVSCRVKGAENKYKRKQVKVEWCEDDIELQGRVNLAVEELILFYKAVVPVADSDGDGAPAHEEGEAQDAGGGDDMDPALGPDNAATEDEDPAEPMIEIQGA